MDKNKVKNKQRQRRKRHIRKTVNGTALCPRFSVYKSLRHMYVQLIDDENGNTIVSASTMSEKLSEDTGNISAAERIGEVVAKKALDVGIHKVCFDRNGFRYHGRVKAVGDAARKAGLVF